MKRLFAFTAVAASLVVAALTFADPPPAGKPATDEDMTNDPVCMMNIHKSTSPYQDTFQGETFYFCNQNCYKLYMENKGRYAGTSQYLFSKSWRVTYFAQPAKIFANTDMKLHFVIEKATKDAKGKPVKVEATDCELIPETGQPAHPKLTIKPVKEEGIFRAACRFGAPGRLSIKIHVTFDDGSSDDASFKLPVLPGEDTDTGHENDGKRMDMVMQHETMRKTGKYWTLAGQALEDGKMDDAKKYFALVKGYQKSDIQMVPHVHEDEIDEFKQIDKEYGAALADMETVLNGNDIDKSKEAWKSVDALQCMECHMKFRFATFSDRNSYPVRNGK